VDNQTGHDFSQIFITEPLIAETLTPIDIIRGENSSTLLTEGNQGSYLNTYVSPDLKTWNLYQDPVLITTTTGIQSIEIEHSELLSQNLVTDLDKVFYQIVLDSESHTEENPPFVISPPTGDIFTESNGEVVIEAENYTSLTNRTDNSPWSASTENGIRFMEAGSGAISTWENGSELSYTVQFNTPGTYYFHPRFIANSGSSNSCFLGVNGTLLGTVNTEVSATWIWDNDETEELIIPTAGQYQIQIRKREAGLKTNKRGY